ncbi:polyprenyl synthetase family protein [Treponema sp.]|uniref:polyprenyl synthetase family protein n=1 Tax=Treponema sp. TaxID=166 RepID=UPI0025D627D9|nr:polyprenyl synthetase family protein [Treponema sp.]MCR5218865.1 polyprenyl synthetase family protein [Treponema sp.]
MELTKENILQQIETVISSTLDTNCSTEWKNLTFGKLDKSIENQHITPLTQPASELIQSGGKRWRPLFLVLCALTKAEELADNSPEQKEILNNAFSLTPLVEFIHTASLIHDDIEDSSDTRRGKPAAYITYGTDTAINAGSWLYFEAFTVIDKLSCSQELKNRLYSAALLEVRRLHLGQAMDISWHRNKEAVPSADQYLSMVKCKTGTLSSLAAKIGCLAAGYSDQTAAQAALLASQVGAGFQIIDDVINLTTGNPGKIRGDDIVEGKKSLPVLLFAEKNPESFKLLSQYFVQAAKEGIKSPAVENAIKLLQDSGCIQEAKDQGIRLINTSCDSFMELFGKNKKSSAQIKELFTRMIPL